MLTFVFSLSPFPTRFLQAFSVFFVCVAFTSNIICLLFIPIQWLFFAASTYVWVQYVWHTGRSLLLSVIHLKVDLWASCRMWLSLHHHPQAASSEWLLVEQFCWLKGRSSNDFFSFLNFKRIYIPPFSLLKRNQGALWSVYKLIKHSVYKY